MQDLRKGLIYMEQNEKIKVYKSGSLKNGIIELIISIIIIALAIVFAIVYISTEPSYRILIIMVSGLLIGVSIFLIFLGIKDIYNGRMVKTLRSFGVKDVGKLLFKDRVEGLKKSYVYKFQYRYQGKDYIMEEQIDPVLYDHYNVGKNVPILVYDRRAIIDYEKIFGKKYFENRK